MGPCHPLCWIAGGFQSGPSRPALNHTCSGNCTGLDRQQRDGLGSSPNLTSVTAQCAVGFQLPHLRARPLICAEALPQTCVSREISADVRAAAPLVSHVLITPLLCSSICSHIRQPLCPPVIRLFPPVCIMEASAPMFWSHCQRFATLASALHVLPLLT